MNRRRRFKAKAKRAFFKKFRDFMSVRGVSFKKMHVVVTSNFSDADLVAFGQDWGSDERDDSTVRTT
jgi:hypothetical protein